MAGNFFRFLRVIFVILLTLLIVYLYYLQTKGMLLAKILGLWKSYKKLILILSGIVAYSATIFWFGFKMGRKK